MKNYGTYAGVVFRDMLWFDGDGIELGKIVAGDGRVLYALGDQYSVQLFDPARDFEQVVNADMKDAYSFEDDEEPFDYEEIGNIEILETIAAEALSYLGIEPEFSGRELQISVELVRPEYDEAEKVLERIM